MTTPEHGVPEVAVERVVRDAIQRGRQLRQRRNRVRLAVTGTLAAALVAGVVVLIGSAGSSTNGPGSKVPTATNPRGNKVSGKHPKSGKHPTTTTQPTPTTQPTDTVPTAASIPADFQPMSFTAVSLDEWWLLGTARCASGSGTCGAIVHTTNGGSSFTAVSAPPVSAGDVTQLGYANASDGYAFGPELWETTNDGASWTRQSTPGPVTQLEIASGEAYALVCEAAGTGTGNCQSPELLRSAVGSGTWQKVSPPVALSYGAQFTLSGANLYVIAGNDGSGLWYSDDEGATFSKREDPCTVGLGGSVTASADGSTTLWAACPTGTEAGAWVSTNGGGSWSSEAAGFDNQLQLTAASSSVALAWPSQQISDKTNALEQTTNGGSSFSAVLSGSSSSRVLWAGYSDPSRSYALIGTPSSSGSSASETTVLYESNNGGATWHAVTIKA